MIHNITGPMEIRHGTKVYYCEKARIVSGFLELINPLQHRTVWLGSGHGKRHIVKCFANSADLIIGSDGVSLERLAERPKWTFRSLKDGYVLGNRHNKYCQYRKRFRWRKRSKDVLIYA